MHLQVQMVILFFSFNYVVYEMMRNHTHFFCLLGFNTGASLINAARPTCIDTYLNNAIDTDFPTNLTQPAEPPGRGNRFNQQHPPQVPHVRLRTKVLVLLVLYVES